jgi:hypothetical protein
VDPDAEDRMGFPSTTSVGYSGIEGRSWSWKDANDTEVGVEGGSPTEARHFTTCGVVFKPFRLGNALGLKFKPPTGNQKSLSMLE